MPDWLKFIRPYVPKFGNDWHDPKAAQRRVDYDVFPARAAEQLALLLIETRRLLPSLTVPVRLIYSHNDRTAPPSHGRAYYDHLGSQDKDLILIKGSGHILTDDAQRERVAALVGQWIADQIKRETVPAPTA